MDISLNDSFDAYLITGPTAGGKSALALDIAARVDGVIINADSMQVYDTLDVLTARPPAADRAVRPHKLYGHVPAPADYSTGRWLDDVFEVMKQLDGKKPVFVGGTGLYFKALTEGIAVMPAIDPAVRAHYRGLQQAGGASALHAELEARDPAVAAKLGPGDAQRIVRALEVLESTGRSIAAFQAENSVPLVDAAQAQKIVVLPERAALHQRINSRFEAMLDQGAVEEVRALMALDLAPTQPLMKAIGVREIAAMLDGKMTREEVIEKASAATRQYAKRQMTWFRNQMGTDWARFDPLSGAAN
ncbi:tRNA (adenosine(37)-N6)-dimethylallyltransferase MiaA [Martelella alba]|uniref:tRNA dimethylallyltransferase n=1 Tax=Martelella alba TaxID=2590451 RepID=A0A506UJX4_9HYPH|nr:tRNA (adenosine(37)-N6)-dimethylallyltransferase MiaA [Martelella alba]TPW33641.1 tRNA (adenosine(37)-N6)-dimethylallyltransferase MiaA [Martelella alba]